jgi:DNA-binding PucR family transcriptional regulator
MSEVNYTGVELKVRASPTQSPEEITQQVISQLAPYLRQVFSTYQVVYRIRLIIQPVLVKTPQPAVTIRAIVKKPIAAGEGEGYEEEGEEGEELAEAE